MAVITTYNSHSRTDIMVCLFEQGLVRFTGKDEPRESRTSASIVDPKFIFLVNQKSLFSSLSCENNPSFNMWSQWMVG